MSGLSLSYGTPVPPSEKFLKISELRPFLKGVNIVFIVLEKDSTGSINFSLWDTEAEWLSPGDIIRLKGGYCSLFKNSLILYAGRYGSIERIGEFTMLFVESPNVSLLQWTQDPNNPSVWTAAPPSTTTPPSSSIAAARPLPQFTQQPNVHS